MNRRERRLKAPVSRQPSMPLARSSTVESSDVKPWWQSDWSVVAAILLGFTVYRFAMMAGEPGPSGSDAGNWLAFTRGLFGQDVKAADSMYFPGTLVLLKALMLFLPDLLALKTLAVIVSVGIAVPFYFLARMACSKPIAVALTVLMLTTGFLMEMMAWGGYPQLLASAFSLGALLYADRWLHDGTRNDVLKAAALTGLVAFTHHFMLIVLILTFAIYAAVTAFKLRAEWLTFGKRLAGYGGASAVACLLSLPWYLQYMNLLAGQGSLNATSSHIVGLNGAISYLFSEAPLTWIVLCTVAPAIALLPFGDAGARRLRVLAASILIAPMLVYAFTHEHRAMQQGQAGALLCLGLIATYVWSVLPRLPLRPTVVTAGRATVALAGLGLMMILIPNAHSREVVVRDKFQAMDSNAVQALDWLRTNTPRDTVVLPGNNHGVANYAWWVEGYAQRPAYGLIFPEFLSFKQEIAQSEVAWKITDDSTPLDEVQRLLDESNIRYLFIYKPSGGEFQRIADSLPVTIAYQNDEFIIFKVPVASASAHE